MRATNTYLMFDGNCREAMTFYGKCLQAEPNFTPFSAGPAEMPPAAKTAPDRVLHAELASGPMVLMASDTMPGMPFQQGNNFSVCIDCESQEEIDRLFKTLGENGQVTMPLQDAFWGDLFGMLTDQFGISWMFNFRDSSRGH
jgi:PhnB protein